LSEEDEPYPGQRAREIFPYFDRSKQGVNTLIPINIPYPTDIFPYKEEYMRIFPTLQIYSHTKRNI
jgi:hypothetical protein